MTNVLFFSSCHDYTKENHIKIGFSQCISGDVWRTSMDHTMKLEASLYPNIDLKIFNANRNIKTQIEQIENMIDGNFDVIIISPLDSKSLTPIIDKAYSKGIPVILIDRKVNSENYTTYLGADNLEVGRLAGRYLAALSKGKGNIVEIYAELNTSPGYERSLGFRQIISQFPNLNLISRIEAKKNGLQIKDFERVLNEKSSIDYVYAFNDDIAYQAWEVAKRKGREKQIKFIGIDGLNGPNGGVQWVKDGILTATILYPTGGIEAIRLAIKIAKKELVPKNNKLETVLIDSLNASIMSTQFDKISQQQSNIETQQNVIKDQEKEQITLYNLIKLLMFFLVVIFSLALFSVYSIISIRKKKKLLESTNYKIVSQRNEIEKFAEKLKISNEAKMIFFTGLSHEFKTPLTLILSSVESLHDEFKNKSHNVKKDLDIMYNNSRRLLRLINQLLDFRKIEDKQFSLKATKTNLWDFSKNIFKEFDREAKKRNIIYTISTNNKEVAVFLDQNLMDKVYYNLLSNCFKFTPDNGRIEVSINEDIKKSNVTINFKDSGIGIPENELSEIFNPFYQGSNNYKNGSGVGLNLSKNFVDLHGGSIEVKSNKGAEFSVILKLGNAHLDKTKINNDIGVFSDANYVYDYLDTDVIQVEEAQTNEKKLSVLIIEDNVDLLEFISSKLQQDYNVIKCNGTKAIEEALNLIPEIIICDLNLPDKNGFEICEALKTNVLTSHIPTIILTAVNDQDTYLKALEAGADLFLTKPFNLKVLKESIKGLLFNREKLRYYYTNNSNKIEADGLGLIEKEFLNKIDLILEKNIDDSSFSVEDLANCLNISRVQLYRKVKAVLGIGVGDYINNFRLEKAKELLKTTTLNISEIAYSCGFASPNYFSTTFKSKYSISPKDFRNN